MADEEFIDLVRQYPVIYNTKMTEYRDAAKKNEAWEEISRLKNISVEECKSAWNKLRNCYNNAIKRRALKTGQAAKKIPPWRFEENLSFLLPFMKGRENWGNTEGTDEDYSPQSEVIYVSKQSPASATSPPVSPSPPPMHRTPSPPIRGTKRHMPDDITQLVDMIRNSHESLNHRQEFDDTDNFFLSMSRMLKKLPKKDQITIKLDLHRAIHDAELKQLEAENK